MIKKTMYVLALLTLCATQSKTSAISWTIETDTEITHIRIGLLPILATSALIYGCYQLYALAYPDKIDDTKTDDTDVKPTESLKNDEE